MTFVSGIYIQAWQLGSPYSSENNFTDAVALCQSYGIAGILVKAFDGIVWHAAYAPEPDALHSVEQAQEQQAFARERGVGYGVWTNPLHGSRAELARQADIYAELGAAVGLLAFDTEPYQSFWGANRPAGSAAFFMDRFRAGAPDCATIWQPDPRPNRLAELRPEEWAPHMNVYAPQVYWTDFQRPADEVLAEAFDGYQQLGIAEWAPTLPGNAEPEDLTAAADLIRAQGAAGGLVWRLGTTGPRQLDALRWVPLPPPADPCSALRAAIRSELATLDAALAGAAEVRERLAALL
jgi:hypothetical protein